MEVLFIDFPEIHRINLEPGSPLYIGIGKKWMKKRTNDYGKGLNQAQYCRWWKNCEKDKQRSISFQFNWFCFKVPLIAKLKKVKEDSWKFDITWKGSLLGEGGVRGRLDIYPRRCNLCNPGQTPTEGSFKKIVWKQKLNKTWNKSENLFRSLVDFPDTISKSHIFRFPHLVLQYVTINLIYRSPKCWNNVLRWKLDEKT